MSKMPHMCRDDHAEIWHADSEHERCPLCRMTADRDRLAAELAQQLNDTLMVCAAARDEAHAQWERAEKAEAAAAADREAYDEWRVLHQKEVDAAHRAAAASAKDAARYQYWRGKIEWLEDEGIAGCAYSAQIPLADIDRLSKSELMDAIADRSTARKENAASIGQTEEPRK